MLFWEVLGKFGPLTLDAQDKRHVVVPSIDTIGADDWSYKIPSLDVLSDLSCVRSLGCHRSLFSRKQQGLGVPTWGWAWSTRPGEYRIQKAHILASEKEMRSKAFHGRWGRLGFLRCDSQHPGPLEKADAKHIKHKWVDCRLLRGRLRRHRSYNV